jgi:hypothetical protein
MTACIEFFFAGCNCDDPACVRILEGTLLHLQFLRTYDINFGSCGRVHAKTLSSVRENVVRLTAVCLESLFEFRIVTTRRPRFDTFHHIMVTCIHKNKRPRTYVYNIFDSEFSLQSQWQSDVHIFHCTLYFLTLFTKVEKINKWTVRS